MKKLLLLISALFVTSANAAETNKKSTVSDDADNIVLLQLKDGTVEIQLQPEKAPKTVARIKELVRQGFYNGIVFHRVIDGFMVQGGDPTGTGTSGSGKKLPDEFPSQSDYSRGTVAMANAGPGTSDSQFFIMLKDTPLPPQYTVFGKVIKGMPFVDKIKKGDQYDNGVVSNPDKIISMKLATESKK